MSSILMKAIAGFIALFVLSGCARTHYGFEPVSGPVYADSSGRTLLKTPDGITITLILQPEAERIGMRLDIVLAPGASVQFNGDELMMEDVSNGKRQHGRLGRFLLERYGSAQSVRYESFGSTERIEGFGHDLSPAARDKSYLPYNVYSMEGVRFHLARPTRIRLHFPPGRMNDQPHQFGPLEFVMTRTTRWVTNIQ